MPLKLYNTLTRQKEAFRPLQPGSATLYTCGPTVYDAATIGNLRTYVFQDVLRRWLAYGHGLTVKQAMNITDVEDKIIVASKAKTVAALAAFTKPHEQRFFADLAALGIERAEVYPHATAFVPQMITMIEAILAAGYAYERNGSVYFDVAKYHADHGYGKLLKIDFMGFTAGQRIDHDEYDKAAIQDFALWKAVDRQTPGWDSPWGYGRPGWHLECSVMVAHELGETIDIHTGAVDLIFPHHENEIAQSQAGTGQSLARYWVHGGHLLVDGERMGKSKQNFHTLAEVTGKGCQPAVLRLLYLQAHYRSKLNFTWESLTAAGESYQRLQEFRRKLGEVKLGEAKHAERLSHRLEQANAAFTAAIDDDLNTPEALATVFELVREVNAMIDAGGLDQGGAQAVSDQLDAWDDVLGVLSLSTGAEVPDEIQALVDQREQARQGDDYAASDQLRDQLAKLGWSIEDTEHGPRLRKISQ